MTYSSIFINKNQTMVPIPVVAVFLVVVFFFLFTFFNKSSLPTQASQSTLVNQQIVNVSPGEVGLFWQTDKPMISWLIFGTAQNKLDQILVDARDLPNKKLSYTYHFAQLKGIAPRTTYYYEFIVQTGNVIRLVAQTNGTPFTLTTPSSVVPSTNVKPAYGKVVDVNEGSVANAIVLLSAETIYPLVTVTKTTGDWLIPLNNLLDRNTRLNIALSPNTLVTISIFSEDNGLTTITAPATKLSPLPQTIVVGKNYNFINNEQVLSAQNTRSTTQAKIAIIFPAEGAVIPGLSPIIKGQAYPGRDVIIVIHSSTTYSYRVKADNNGLWEVLVPDKLAPGVHTLSVVTSDENGNQTTLTRNFTIAKSGEEVLGEATAAATPTKIPPGQPTPLPTYILASPTIATMAASPTPPVTGSSITQLVFVAVSFIIVGAGVLVAF